VTPSISVLEAAIQKGNCIWWNADWKRKKRWIFKKS